MLIFIFDVLTCICEHTWYLLQWLQIKKNSFASTMFGAFDNCIVLRKENRWQYVEGPLSKLFGFFFYMELIMLIQIRFLLLCREIIRCAYIFSATYFALIVTKYVIFGKTVRHHFLALSTNDIENMLQGICYYALFAFDNKDFLMCKS